MKVSRFWRIALPAVAVIVAASVIGGPATSASAAETLLSQDKLALASSYENSGVPPAAAFDSNAATRWSSDASDAQWLRVDLAWPSAVTRVQLQWEGAYAKAFQLQTSSDGTTWSTIYSTTTGTGGTQNLAVNGFGRYVRMLGTQRATPYGYSLYEFQVYGTSGEPATGNVPANPPATGVTPSQANPPHAYFHEFQANCAVSRSTLPDDPIVFFGQPGASHSHTFMGNTTTNASSTLASLQAGGTSCIAPGDKSGYWMPTMLNGTQEVLPVGPQVIYYKTNLIDYTSVRPFPLGIRFVVGNPANGAAEFAAQSYEGWECGESYHNADIPVSCPNTPDTQLNIRFQAPSCWDGVHLDSPDHRSHMAYPVNGRCTAGHPVALPMIEFKMAFPVRGNLANVHLASGRGFSFHYDFFNAWDPATQAALVNHCIVGGLQCDARGFDQAHPEKGAALGPDYRLP
jgi:Domain of unknown function (DUF1996)/F5/8 type C domain